MRVRVVIAAATLAASGTAVSAQGSASSTCRVLCAPTFTLMPSMIRTHLFGGPLVRDLTSGAESRLPSATSMEVILATSAKTAVPHLGVFVSVQWLPNATEKRNPFTLYTASELGGSVRANAPTATFGLSGSVVAATQTAGWLDAGVNLGDLYSQAARPDDRSAYTHKLDLEAIAHLHAFNWTPAATYMHRVTVFGILDYAATGLPRAGDEVPQGRRFLTDARPTSLIAGLALPLTPEAK